MAKTFSINTFSLSLSLLLLLIATSFPGGAAALDYPRDALRDINNKMIVAGAIYLMHNTDGNFPVFFTNVGQSVCPSFVAVDTSDRIAFPLRILLADPGETFVRLNVSVSFQFKNTVYCVNSSVWQVALPSQNINGQRLITLGGEQGPPGCNTVQNWFKINRDPRNGYNIVYDPNDVCNIPVQRYSVAPGINIVNEARILQLVNGRPMQVVFELANSNDD
ncbi:uncharacterized protein LOC127255133 [Andrographis paniculata]|uniref:uncharacterized protein LOC127255133 n=1 Tax=Andrographis paniculata TaxID=175694 RepID=UPI0021E7638E|nr:uncharacterized protein LOC127255133 [Andrographis paniculata]